MSVILVEDHTLSAIERELILLGVAAAQGSSYWVRLQAETLRTRGVKDEDLDRLLKGESAGLPENDTALLAFALRLSQPGPWQGRQEIQAARGAGLTDESILDAILVTALARMFCTVAAGLAPEAESKPLEFAPPAIRPLSGGTDGRPAPAAPYLRTVERSAEEFPAFAYFQQNFGRVPNLFRAQTLRPDAIEAEANAIRLLLDTEDLLTHTQKQCILLVLAAADSNTYCVAAHSEILRRLGMAPEEADQIALNYRHADLPERDRGLLEFAVKIGAQSREVDPEDVNALQEHGFAPEHILEAVAVAAFGNFLNMLQKGLGVVAEVEPRRMATARAAAAPAASSSVATAVSAPGVTPGEDPDAGLVSRVRDGDVNAFEDLVRRHTRRVYRTLLGMLGEPEDAKDAMQDAFLKAFEHIAEFQGRSRFSTWLLTISRNTALQRLRDRPKEQTMSDEDLAAQDYRPEHLRSWQDNPERLYSRTEMRRIVDEGLYRLPAEYRVAIVLRDLEQLSTREVASALGLSVAAVKARVFRGRLMLRDELSSYFATQTGGTVDDRLR